MAGKQKSSTSTPDLVLLGDPSFSESVKTVWSGSHAGPVSVEHPVKPDELEHIVDSRSNDQRGPIVALTDMSSDELLDRHYAQCANTRPRSSIFVPSKETRKAATEQDISGSEAASFVARNLGKKVDEVEGKKNWEADRDGGLYYY